MKTNFISFPKPSLKSTIGFLSILILASCGSYQNSSYYDNDGIYGTTERRFSPRESQNESSSVYQNYFSSLQDSIKTTPILTDVNQYGSYNTSDRQNNINYPGWGSNPQEVVINYSPNNWGLAFDSGYPFYGYGWGWGSSFYGYRWNSPYNNYWNTYYGWGYPYYGYGYGSMNYPYYGGYGNSNYLYRSSNYSYNPSRRGSSYSNATSSRNYIGRTYSQEVSRYNNNNRTGSSTSFGRYSSSGQNHNYSNDYIGRTSGNNNSTPTQNYASPSRTYSPNATRRSEEATPSHSTPNTNRNDNYTPSRSSDSNYGRSSSSGSYGGSNGSYGGGGGRRGGR